MNGAPSGTSGGRTFWLSYALVAVGVFVVNAINVLNGLHEAREGGVRFSPGTAVLLEASSGVPIVALIPLIWLAAQRWPLRQQGWPRLAVIHVACATAFSLLHVAGMLAIRSIIPALHERAAGFGLDSFFYEYRKDLLVYAVMLASGVVLGDRLKPAAEPGSGATEPTRPEPSFDIREGARLIRTPVREIAAVVSAGNYVEFKLVDGRSPLMRTTLAAVEAQLGPYGFLRTHRSWLVNPARVRVIAPSGSGDRRLELEGGLEAPLSRRYAEALEQLRAI